MPFLLRKQRSRSPTNAAWVFVQLPTHKISKHILEALKTNHSEGSDQDLQGARRGPSVFCECKLSETGPKSERARPTYNRACWDSNMEPPLALTELSAADSHVPAAQKMCCLELGEAKGGFKSQPYHARVLLASLPKNRISLL